jgi:hypothetical protein
VTEDWAHSFLTAIAECQLKVLRLPEAFKDLSEPARLEAVQHRVREHYQKTGGKCIGFGEILRYRYASDFDHSIVPDIDGNVIEQNGGRFCCRKSGWSFTNDWPIKQATKSTLNLTSKLATVTTGVKQFFYSPHGTVALFATAKAGVATGDGSATAVFAGGGGTKVFLAGAATKFPFLKLFSTIPNSYVSGTVDIQQINGAGVSPTFGFAIGADFKYGGAREEWR